MSESKHWWEGYPWRMVQTNFRQIDMDGINAESYAQDLQDFGATVVTLNAAGIIASYATELPFQTKSDYLSGDSLQDLIDACHKRGIRVIARTDFSKVRYPVFEQHQDWAYRDRNGNILDYNGDVQMCPNGEYQQERMFDILKEVLSTHDFDGVFCNMSGFLVVDYSGVYHGPCHCENCKQKFKAEYGLDIPDKDDPKNPEYKKYAEFKSKVLKAHRKKLVETVRAISPEIAINNTDYIRTEAATEIGRAQWAYHASSNARQTAGPLRSRPADSASVDFLGFRYRDTSVSPGQLALRQWQNLANAGSVSLYIMGRLDNHLDRTAISATKPAFDFHREHEELFRGLTSAAKVGLIQKGVMALNDPEVYGWLRALTESHIPFDEVKLAELTPELLSRWNAVILGDVKNLSSEQAEMVDRFAEDGGVVIASGGTGFGKAELKAMGVLKKEEPQSGMMSSVFEIPESEVSAFPRCSEAHYIAPGAILYRAAFEPGTKSYLRLIGEHPFGPPERCYYTEVSKQPGIFVHTYGQGKCVVIPWLIGSFYFNEGYANSLRFLQDVLFEICGIPQIAPDLSPMVEVTICEKQGQTVVQLVNGSGVFANSYFDPVPIRDILLTLDARGRSCHTLNGGQACIKYADGKLNIKLKELKDYEVIVISD